MVTGGIACLLRERACCVRDGARGEMEVGRLASRAAVRLGRRRQGADAGPSIDPEPGLCPTPSGRLTSRYSLG